MKLRKGAKVHVSNYTKGRTSAVRYIVIHYTANKGDKAYANTFYFSAKDREASAHYFVDEYDVCDSVPEKDTAWHCGRSDGKYKHKYCRNSNSIGIEMCSDFVNGKYVITEETLKNTAELVKMLMKKYNLGPDCLVRHYDVTGKICPLPMVTTKVTPKGDEEWNKFKARCK